MSLKLITADCSGLIDTLQRSVPSITLSLSYGEKIEKIGPVRPEIFDVIR